MVKGRGGGMDPGREYRTTAAARARNRRHYMKMIAEGRCVNCGKEDDFTRQGRARCFSCNAKQHAGQKRKEMTREQRDRANADKREWERMRKEAHVCVACGRMDRRTVAGGGLCLRCATKKADRRRETRDFQREKELRDARRGRFREAGLCTECGGKKEDPEMALCATCRLKARLGTTKRKIGRGWTPRGSNGRCYQCNRAPALDGRRLCRECYEKKLVTLRRNSLKRGRKAGEEPEAAREKGE